MNWIRALIFLFLIGCFGGPSYTLTVQAPLVPTGLPPLPPMQKTKAAPKPKIRLMKVTGLKVGLLGLPTNVIRDVHIVGCKIDHAFWNGTAFDVPIGTNWVQIYVPNPNHAVFVQLDWSANLVTWTNVGYFKDYTNGVWLVDPTAVGQPMRFYRLGAAAVPQ